MIRSRKIRLYPTKEQEQLMFQHIGACRYIWNWMIEQQQKNHENGGKHIKSYDMIRMLPALKNDGNHDWLYDVSNATCQQVCIDLEKAYIKFFNKVAGYPKFKSRKKSNLIFPTPAFRLYFTDTHVQCQKIGKIKYKTDFQIPTGKSVKFINPRISLVNGKWFLTVGYEFEKQEFKLTDKEMGIDLGVKNLMIVAFGDEKIVFPNINKCKKLRLLNKKLKHTQQSVSRKYNKNKHGTVYKRTNNINRQLIKLRKIHCRIANIRNNYIHQSTHYLVSLLPKRIVMEDLNVLGMMKNRCLARCVQEQCFAEVLRQMEYKCEAYGIEFVKANRFFPSSRLCPVCGCINKGLKLNDRIFVCPDCGYTEDRDFNAALNLQRYNA